MKFVPKFIRRRKEKILQTILSASYGSVQSPTFNFGLNFDDDTDELPTQKLLMRIIKTHCSNTGNM